MAERSVSVRLRLLNDQYRKGLAEAQGDTTKFGAAAKGAFAGFGSELKSAGDTMTRNVTLPLVGLGVAATKLGTDFDATFAKMTNLAGVAADEVAGLKDEILGLAQSTGRGPQELAEGLYFASSAGLDTATSLELVKAAAQAAAVGLGSTQSIVQTVTAAIGSYGAGNLSAAEALDVLTAGAKVSTVEMAQLAPQLGRLLPTAQALGVSFDEVTAALGYLSTKSGDAALSGTQLDGVLRKILVPSEQGRKALAAVGLSADQLRATVTSGGLPAALDLLKSKFGGNSDALFQLFDDIQAFQGAQLLLTDATGGLGAAFDATANSAGSASKAFEVASGTDAFKLQQAFAQAKVALIEFGAALAPLITALAPIAGAFFDAFGKLPDWLQTGAAGFAVLLAAIGPIMSITGRLVQNFQMLADGVRGAFRLMQTGALNVVGSLGTVALALGAVSLVAAAFAVNWWRSEQAAKAARQRVDEYAEAIRNAGSVAGGAADVVEGMLRKSENIPILEALGRAGVSIGEFSAAVAAGGDQFDDLRTKIIAALAETELTGNLRDELSNVGLTVDDLIADLGKGGNAFRLFGVTAPTPAMQSFIRALAGLNGEILPLGSEFSQAARVNELFNGQLGVTTTSANAAEARLNGYGAAVANIVTPTYSAADATRDLLATFDSLYARAFNLLDANLDYADALAAVGTSSSTAAGSTRNLAAEQRDAVRQAEAITKAQLELADAEAALVEARKGPTDREKGDAQLGVREANLSLKEAQKGVADAQKQINEERKKGKEGDVKGATLALERASLNLTRAQLAVADAQANQNKVLNSGAETSDKVTDAVDSVTAAQERLRDAEWAAEEAQNRQVAGTGRVVDKQKELAGQLDTVLERGNGVIRTMIEMGRPGGEVLTAIANQAAALDDLIAKHGDVNGKLAAQKELLLQTAIAQGLTPTVNPETGFIYYDLPKRAGGGPTMAGQSYVVGEKGPEIWTAGASGYVTPNDRLTAASSYVSTGGGMTSLTQPLVLRLEDDTVLASAVVRVSHSYGALDIKIQQR